LKKGKRELMSIERLLGKRGNRFFNLDSVQLLAPLSFGFAVTFLLARTPLSTSAGDCATRASRSAISSAAAPLVVNVAGHRLPHRELDDLAIAAAGLISGLATTARALAAA
jgi:hypothetical protein